MNIRKEASVCTEAAVNEQMLEKINRYTKTPLTAEQVYCFSVRLCDDLPDRDFERFDTAALPILAELFCGKTGIVDHDWSADRQVARIFDTQVCSQEGVSFVLAWCYVLRTPGNTELIAQIEGGIKKEVSVGCAVGESRCSICGKAYGTCEHRKGLEYDGQTCVAVLCEPTDAYEFSFVAVPAQPLAGVLKAKTGGESMTLQELVSKNGTSAMCDSLKVLQDEAEFGRQCRTERVESTVALCLQLGLGEEAEILKKAFDALSFAELSALQTTMRRKANSLYPNAPQLPCGTMVHDPVSNDYMI